MDLGLDPPSVILMEPNWLFTRENVRMAAEKGSSYERLITGSVLSAIQRRLHRYSNNIIMESGISQIPGLSTNVYNNHPHVFQPCEATVGKRKRERKKKKSTNYTWCRVRSSGGDVNIINFTALTVEKMTPIPSLRQNESEGN